jgi:hypothetical protein
MKLQPPRPCLTTQETFHCAFFACPRRAGAVLLDFSRSAAHNAAPTVLVKANARLTNGTISNRNATTPNLLQPWRQLMSPSQDGDVRCICRLILLDECFPLALGPFLQLKVPRMSGRSVALAL